MSSFALPMASKLADTDSRPGDGKAKAIPAPTSAQCTARKSKTTIRRLASRLSLVVATSCALLFWTTWQDSQRTLPALDFRLPDYNGLTGEKAEELFL